MLMHMLPPYPQTKPKVTAAVMKHTMWMINKDHLKAPQLIKYMLVLTSTPCFAHSTLLLHPVPARQPAHSEIPRWDLGCLVGCSGCSVRSCLAMWHRRARQGDGEDGWVEREWEVELGCGKCRWCSKFLVVNKSYEKGSENQQCVCPWFTFIWSFWP